MSVHKHPLLHITPEDRAWAEDAASRFGVSAALHREDFILDFLFNNPLFSERREPIEYYFFDGHRSAQKLAALLREIDVEITAPFKLLEFASGFGCVTRHLKNAMPQIDITSSDIHPKALDFIAENMDVKTLQSVSAPQDFDAGKEGFDAVFALSFFSHMPQRTWTLWLQQLMAHVAPGGHLIFTTHGMNSARNHFGNPEIPDSGFWFTADSEQKDLDTAEYGQTIVRRSFVFDAIRALPNSHLEVSAPAFWWTHQDVWVVRKTT